MAPINRIRGWHRDEDGQALALVILGIGALLGVVAMAVDVGNMLVTRQREQSAADAAVLAAVGVVYDGGTHSEAVAEARGYATRNGFTGVAPTPGSGELVEVNIPPTQGKLAGNPDAIEVVISRRVSPVFARFVGAGPWRVEARAVARLEDKVSGFGVITLHETECESLRVGSGSQLRVTNGGIYVNSNCKSGHRALAIGSNNTLTATTVISVTGGYEIGSGSTTSPLPLTDQPRVPDPWKAVPVPITSGLTDRTPTDCRIRSNTTFNPGLYRCGPLTLDGGTHTFNPGTYIFRGGLKVTGQARVTFGRGVYVMQGGGFNMTSNTSATNTTGMLIYNSCNGGCSSADWFHMESSAALTAVPYGAPYENLLVFQDRANRTQVDFNSHSVVNVTGSGAGIYAKNATIEYDCGSTVPLQFVALNVHIGSNARVIVDVASLPHLVLREFRLVE